MLLSITTTARPATDLGFLLHKNPDRVQGFDLAFGRAIVFYPEASAERCTAVLMLDVDPVGLVRGSGSGDGPLAQYVNDRPYAASSFLSVAIARVFGSALGGRCKDRPELAATPIPLDVELPVLPSRGGEGLLRRLLEPLGYSVTVERLPLDDLFPEWGESPYYRVRLAIKARLATVLQHLYVLIPVLDDEKHYWVGDAEVESLLAHAKEWLGDHPQRELIARRYLKHQRSLASRALMRLAEDAPPEAETDAAAELGADAEDAPGPAALQPDVEEKLRLNEVRLAAVLEVLKGLGAKRVLDLGCGEGHLLRLLLAEKSFTEIVGMDVSTRALEHAAEKLHLDRMTAVKRARIRLLHGSLIYRDKRLEGFDAAAVVEVIEHLDPPRLAAFERAVFEQARPGAVVVTTPNVEYNRLFEGMPEGALRHRDHRFEWTRQQLREWAEGVAARFRYETEYRPVGDEDAELGPPTQMVVFSRREREVTS